uniref:FLZ-type domain-containing protein n=1 Tax=Caenorhabditis tropicalis TaxID=1561998 RepID=A0A1I7UP20_9PELO
MITVLGAPAKEEGYDDNKLQVIQHPTDSAVASKLYCNYCCKNISDDGKKTPSQHIGVDPTFCSSCCPQHDCGGRCGKGCG